MHLLLHGEPGDALHGRAAGTPPADRDGYPVPVRNAKKMPAANYIFFNYIREEELGNEGYMIEAGPRSVEINANGDAGFFYGMQTLLQLLPPEVFSPQPVPGVAWQIPCLSLTDKPRFSWRGMHLDVSRHFLPKELHL